MIPPLEVRSIFDAFNPESEYVVLIIGILEFVVDEQLNATRKMSSGKVNGLSGTPNEILNRIVPLLH